MAPKREERRLAAILAADMVGYSRLMEADESGTLAALKAHRGELIDPTIAEHNGRIVKTTGDGMLAEFGSVVDAVAGAVAIQRAMVARNEAVPEDRRIRFRIGINLGDIIFDGGDIYGDGVNIAARLEQLAEPGGVCVSGTAYEHLKAKVDVGYADLGTQQVKNIEKPVRVYRVLLEPDAVGTLITEATGKSKSWRLGMAAAAAVAVIAVAVTAVWWRPWVERVEPASVARMAFPLPDKPSIAVLPFANMSGDPAQEYIADGTTESIITALAKIPKLFVIARNSTFAYKGKPVQVKQVAEDLGVQYVLEGSVQRAGAKVRITVQLVDSLSGHHLWAQEYDREFDDIFNLQDDISQQVVTEVEVSLTAGEKARLRHRQTNNAEAYVRFLQGLEHYQSFNKVSSLQAQKLFEEAVSLDPKFSSAYAFLGWIALKQARLGFAEDEAVARQRALKLAREALALDETDIDALSLLSEIHLDKWDHDTAIALREKALGLSPNHADNMAWLGWRLCFPAVNRPSEGLSLIQRATRLSPVYPNWYLSGIGLCHFVQGDFEAAIAAFDERRKRIPNSWLPYVYLAFAYAAADKMDEARAAVAKLREGNPNLTTEKFGSFMGILYADPTGIEPILAKLREAGLPAHPPLPLPDKPSIAVLPFNNMSGDPEQGYFADGMTEDIITDLSKLSGLFVVARNSSFQHRGDSVDVKKVGRELGVKYVLEGSVRRAGDQVRINAQLVDAQSGGHLWAERYDGGVADVFKLQDRITGEIVRALSVTLSAGEQALAEQVETSVPEAYDAFLRGWSHFRRRTPDDFALAVRYFKKAIALDPSYTRAYAALAALYWDLADKNWSTATSAWSMRLGITMIEGLRREELYLKKAMAKPGPMAHQVASGRFLRQGRHDLAIAEARRAIDLDPNSAHALQAMGTALTFAGQPGTATEWIDKAMRLNPKFEDDYLYLRGLAAFGDKRYGEAARSLVGAARHNPNDDRSLIVLAAAYGHLGRLDAARSAIEKANALRSERQKQLPDSNVKVGIDVLLVGPYTLEDVDFWPFKAKADRERLRDGLRLAGMPAKGKGKAVSPLEVAGATTVDPAAAKKLFDRGVTFIDVRPLTLWNNGYIAGAINLDLKTQFSEESLSNHVAKEQGVVFYCMGPRCLVSSKACAKAVGWGFKKVYYLREGYPGWKAAGYAITVP